MLPAQGERDIFIAEHAEADERRAEAAAARALMVQRDVELCWGDAPLAEQQLTETNSHGPFGVACPAVALAKADYMPARIAIPKARWPFEPSPCEKCPSSQNRGRIM